MNEYEWMNDSLHMQEGIVGKFVGGVKKDRDRWVALLWDGEPTLEICGWFPSREEAQARVLGAAKMRHGDGTLV